MKRIQIQYVFLSANFTIKAFTPLSYIHIDDARPYVEQQHWYYSDMELPVLEMREEFAQFIHKHCRCVYCKKRVAKNLAKCNCGEQNSRLILVEFPTKIRADFETVANFQYYIDLTKRKALRRKNRLAAAGGKHTKSEINSLFAAQKGRCYYCGNPIVGADGKNLFHIDHFVSIADGGTNDISNLVLACPACNIEKGEGYGKYFVKAIAARLTEENRLVADDIRRQVLLHKREVSKHKKRLAKQ